MANHGFGQGVGVTPIQLAVAYAAIANGGYLVRPYVVKAAYDAAGRPLLTHTPQALHRVISPGVAHTMNRLLQGVVNGPDGTGQLARVNDFVVAGKTGTAQMVNPTTGAYYQSRLVASFVGLSAGRRSAPGDPGRALRRRPWALRRIDRRAGLQRNRLGRAQGSERGFDRTALRGGEPAAIRACDQRRCGVGASTDALPGQALGGDDSTAAALIGRDRIPDFSGLSLRRAFALAAGRHLNLEVEGDGYVIAQQPAPGAATGTGSVTLRLAPVIADARNTGLSLHNDLTHGTQSGSGAPPCAGVAPCA